jgi:RNA polymerase sigma-70 factor (ECF subfamily)
LLPDARLPARRRRRAPGHSASRLAGTPEVPRPELAAHLAVPDRDERLHRPDRQAPEARAADRLRPPTPPRAGDGEIPLPDRTWIEPYPDETLGVADGAAAPDARYERREALELAFVAALQHLPPRQRAALVLRDVLGFSAREAAEALQTTVPSVNGALHRARAAVEERLPEQSQQATLRILGDRKLREIAERFADSFERGDVPAILAMLAEDATFAMPPYPEWCRGREAVGESWLMPSRIPPDLRYATTSANGQLALGTYLLDPETGGYLPIALDVLTLRGELVSEVIAFRSPSMFGRFELPERLPATQ